MSATVAERSRVDLLREFRAQLSSIDLDVDTSFQIAFSEAQKLLELSDADLADKLLVSRPTVNRWVRGRNLPRRALRRSIVNWLDGQLTQRVKLHEQQAGKSAGGGGIRSWRSSPTPMAIAAKSR